VRGVEMTAGEDARAVWQAFQDWLAQVRR
jgi:hypothetical protein